MNMVKYRQTNRYHSNECPLVHVQAPIGCKRQAGLCDRSVCNLAAMSGEEEVIEVTIDMVELKKMKVRTS